jgi:hypothetical protein
VKAGDGRAEGGALAGAYLSGDDGGKAVGDGIVEAVDEGGETRKRIEILDGDVLVEGLSIIRNAPWTTPTPFSPSAAARGPSR